METEKETAGKRRVGDGTPGPGRPKGVPNKTTRQVKEALEAAFEDSGGIAKLTEWAKANQTEFYRLWGRLLPQEVNAKHSGRIGTFDASKFTDEQLSTLETILGPVAVTSGDAEGGEGGEGEAGG